MFRDVNGSIPFTLGAPTTKSIVHINNRYRLWGFVTWKSCETDHTVDQVLPTETGTTVVGFRISRVPPQTLRFLQTCSFGAQTVLHIGTVSSLLALFILFLLKSGEILALMFGKCLVASSEEREDSSNHEI